MNSETPITVGTQKLPGRDEHYDVIAGTHRVVDVRLYFDSATGLLASLEFMSDDKSDACELFFSEYQESEGRQIPGRIDVRHGDRDFGTIQVKSMSIAAADAS